MEQIILIGGGGHCRSVIDVIESAGRYTIVGIIDKAELVGTTVLGYKVIGTDADIDGLIGTCKNYHITVGHIKSNRARVQLFNAIRTKGGNFPYLAASTAYISAHAKVGDGSVIMHHAFVNAGAKVGTNCIINTGAVIEHDSAVGNNCHISTGAYINGDCHVDDDCFIGSRSVLVQGIRIANNNLIAAGSVVTVNTEPNSLYARNPARLIKKFN